MCKLYVCSTDNLYFVYNLISLLLQTLLTFLRDCKHWCRTEGISGVHTEWVNILDEADRNHVTLCITNNLELQLFPSKDRLLNQYLSYQTCLQTSCTDGLQLFYIVDKSATGAAHCIGRTQNNWVTKLICNCKCFFHRIGNLTACHLNSQFIHSFLKFNSILATFDCIYLNADDLYIIFVKYTCSSKLGTQIKTRLTTEVR